MIDDNVRTYKLGLPRNCRMIMFKHYSTEVLKVKIQFPGRNLFGTLLALNRKNKIELVFIKYAINRVNCALQHLAM